MDDEHTMARSRAPPQEPGMPAVRRVTPPPDAPQHHRLVRAFPLRRQRRDDYQIDRKAQKTISYTGIDAIFLQDRPWAHNRTNERLGSSDAMVIRTRKRLIDAARRYGTAARCRRVRRSRLRRAVRAVHAPARRRLDRGHARLRKRGSLIRASAETCSEACRRSERRHWAPSTTISTFATPSPTMPRVLAAAWLTSRTRSLAGPDGSHERQRSVRSRRSSPAGGFRTASCGARP